MHQKDLDTLDELEREVSGLRQLIQDNRRKHQPPSKVLFRGQSDAEWDLTTTLERHAACDISIREYNTTLCAIAPAVCAFTEKAWEVADKYDLNADWFTTPPNYEFMVYVRHYGFPSPLLDWSQSLYVALFFAFQRANTSERVAVYTYIETLRGAKGGWVGAPQISAPGPYLRTHPRHFMHQGQYTVAVQRTKDQWVYCSHAAALSESRGDDQDVLCKYTLPTDLKHAALRKLNEMNINAFTLFSTEESLMEMLAYKELTLHRLDREEHAGQATDLEEM